MVVCVLLSQASACRSQSRADKKEVSAPVSSSGKEELDETFALSSLASSVRPLGRAEIELGALRYAWSGAGLLVRFAGTGISADITDHGNLHSVILDGRRVSSFQAGEGRRSYELVSGIPSGEHTLELRRRTEASFGITELHSLSVQQGALLPPGPAPERLLEVIGDSISCGYGNLGNDPSCPFSAETEDHEQSYGRLLAEKLGAELSTVAWSGRGVVKNYAGQEAELMPVLYLRSLPTDVASEWSFARPADYVLINLGTNDFSTAPDPQRDAFSLAYASFLAVVRLRNPHALIVATVGPMLQGKDRERASKAIARAVSLRGAAGDERVHFHAMETKNENPGCDYHPGLSTHRAMADELFGVLEGLTAE